MKAVYLLICIIISTILFSQPSDKLIIVSKDSLKVNINCGDIKLAKEYFDLKGIKISKLYDIIDTLNIDINYDNINDKIVVLSPLSQIYRDTLIFNGCQLPRLLMVLLSKGKIHYVGYVNDKVILNTYDYQNDPYEGIVKFKNGLTLKFEIGSIIYCTYQFDFIVTKSGLQLYSKHYSCFNKSNPDEYDKRRILYTQKKYFLKSIDTQKLIDIPNLLEKK